MRRLIAWSTPAIGLLVGRYLEAHGWPHWFGLALACCALPLAYSISQCPHAGPISLLPATTDLNGDHLPARWCCHDCGKDWPANIDRPQTPIPRFTGYDEAKAVAAAKRAGQTTAQMAEQDRLARQRKSGLSAVRRGA